MLRTPVAAIVLAIALVVAVMQATSGWLGIVTTHGFSMEPTYRQGDLVVTRRTGSYEPGEIIAYRSEQLADEVVLHRVIDVRDGRYLTQGDNNDWVDTDRPSGDDIVGAAWFHVPGVGRLLTPLRRAGPLVAVGASLLISLALTRSKRPDPAPRTASMRLSTTFGRLLTPSARPWLLAALAASGLLSLTSMVQPVSSLTPMPVDLRHRGTFSYGAPAEPSIVYPDGSVDTGDPIFRSATDELTIRYEHHLEGPGHARIGRGTLHGSAVLRVGAWEHTLQPLRPAELRRNTAAVEATIDFDEIQALVDQYRAVSGEKNDEASVVVTPMVTAEVLDGSGPGATEFSTSLALTVTPDEIGVVQDQLDTNGSDTVDVLSDTTNHLEAFGRALAVPHARWAGIGGALAAAALLLAAAVIQRRSPRRAAIAAACRGRLVTVEGLDHLENTISVLDQRAFLRIADDADARVLHGVDDAGNETFVIDDGRNRYRYSTETGTGASSQLSA